MKAANFITFLAVFVLVCGAPRAGMAQKAKVDGIAIVVNNSVITVSEYRKKEKNIKKQVPEATRKDVIDSIVSEQLILNAAAERKLNVSNAELNAALEEFKQSMKLDDVGFIKFMDNNNFTLQDFFADIRLQIMTRKLVQAEVERLGISIDDKAVEDYYLERNPGADRDASVRIAHILMPLGGQTALEKAARVAEQAREGVPFGELARRHSIDARTAGQGGDLGYFKHDELILPLQNAVKGADAGDIGGPVRSDAGFHIVKVLALKEAGVVVPPEVKNALVDEMISRETERIISNIIEKGLHASLIEVRI